MRILAFDTTMNACAIALWADGGIVARRIDTMTHGQAEALVPAIEATLAEAGLGYADLDRIAVTTGPGSFTGVRVGLATARGLGLAAGLPVIGIGTAEVLAATARRTEAASGEITVVIDARRAEVYAQTFDARGAPLGGAQCLLPSAVTVTADTLLAGDAVARVAGRLPAKPHAVELAYADPADLAALASVRSLDGPAPTPLYVRPPDAVVPRDGGRLRP
jgi:tRNA threonylcarbamoyladenosine biosynthesis protein TsaB